MHAGAYSRFMSDTPTHAPQASAARLTLQALRHLHVGPIDLALNMGECISIMAPSGAGKSVLLRMVADLDPHEGEAFLDGIACSAMSAPQWRRQVTYVPAESGWWDEYVAPHFPKDFDFALWLPKVGLNPEAHDWPVARLSTGERQRLALLRAIRPECKVLLLDEPTSGLDPDTIQSVEALLASLQRERGLSIMLVTHSAEQAKRMAARQFALKDGRLQRCDEDRP